MKLIFASNNPNKLKEIKKIIPTKIKLLNLRDIKCFDDIPENEKTIEKNAIFKANFIHVKFNVNVFSDDTGLEVSALNGEPGVYSARYAGDEKNTEKNIEKLLFKMRNIKSRKARFKTVIALYLNKKLHLFEGIVNGEILNHKKGLNGFGYDCIFKPNGYDKSFGELPLEIKNRISHRAIATKKLINFLKLF
tara:strand:- start:307 stop:882 length:576 start_codon:yes stop_codon:yes gene_type:complete